MSAPKEDFKKCVDSGLILASEFADADIMQVFLEHGADVHQGKDRALQNVAWQGSSSCVLRLLQYGADPTAENEASLRWASYKGHFECVLLLLDAQWRWSEDILTYTLVQATTVGHLPTLKRLLDMGVDIHFNSEEAMYQVAYFGSAECIHWLLDAGVTAPHALSVALHTAKRLKDRALTQRLLALGAV